MLQKYNLALLPLTITKKITELSHQLSELADTYLLGDTSLPHLTLYQFKYEESDLPQLWERICNAWHSQNIFLELKEISCISFDAHTYWASLLPSQTSEIFEMHSQVATILGLPVKKNFDPHVTLINTLNPNYTPIAYNIISPHIPLKDEFKLALGSRDIFGQFTSLIYSLDLPNNLSLGKGAAL